MSEQYQNKLRAQIGRVTAKAKADNYFPVTGKTITINAQTKWGQTSEWQLLRRVNCNRSLLHGII